MATRPPEADAVTVRLSEIHPDLRRAVAHELASYWKLKGIPYVQWIMRAERPAGEFDVAISVPVEKAALVAAGQRPRGNLDNELKMRPMEFVR